MPKESTGLACSLRNKKKLSLRGKIDDGEVCKGKWLKMDSTI